LFREVMRTKVVALAADATVEDLRHTVFREPVQRGQHLFPVVDAERRVSGVITRKQLRALTQSAAPEASLGDIVRDPVVANPDEPLRVVVFRMAETGLTRMPVIESDGGKLVGMVSLEDLLLARVRNLTEETASRAGSRIALPFPQPGD